MLKKIINYILSLFSNNSINKKEINLIKESKKEIMSEKIYKITKNELLSVSDEIPEEYQKIFNEFFEKINIFRDKCNLPMSPTSYFRSKERQIRIYKEKAINKEFPFENGIYDEKKVPLSSKHMTGYAADFRDSNKKLAHWVLDNLEWCKENNFYFENFGADIDTFEWNPKLDKTPTWIHIQIIPPKSGRIIFNP